MKMNHTLAFKKLIENCGLTVYKNEPLSRHCTWRIGGPADFLVEPSSETQIREILVFCRAKEIPYIVIGKGSNLLFDDAGLRGVIVKIDRRFSAVSVRENIIVAQSGVFVPRLARLAWRHGLSGLEHTVGIPGNLGGLVSMNGGSQRKSISEVVEWVKVVDRDGRIRVLSKKDCGFSYRHSTFQNTDLIIVEAGLKLQYGESKIIHSKMLETLRSRRAKFPRRLPNCGSVFKSAIEIYETIGPPWKVIEELGLKGYKIGGAEISCKHANFIVNKGRAKAQDVLQLIKTIRKRAEVLQADLCCEVLYVDVEGTVRYAQEACE